MGAVQDVDVSKGKVMMEKAMSGDLFYLRVMRELRESSENEGGADGEGWGTGADGGYGKAEHVDGMEVDTDTDAQVKHTQDDDRKGREHRCERLRGTLRPLKISC